MTQNVDNTSSTPKIKTFRWLYIHGIFDGIYFEDNTFCEQNVCTTKSFHIKRSDQSGYASSHRETSRCTYECLGAGTWWS
jgi:hypothetical protein